MKEKIQNYATIIIPTAVLIAGILLIWWAYGAGVAEVMTKRTTAEEIEAKAKIQTTSETRTEATAEADTLEEADASADLAKVDMYDLNITYYEAATSIGTLVDYHESTEYHFSAEVGPSMYVYTDVDGQIKAIQTEQLLGWPTTLYYADKDTYQKLTGQEKNFLRVSGKPIAKVVVGKSELLLDSEQLSLMTNLFKRSGSYLTLTEIGQLGYLQGSKVKLSRYLERCDYAMDDDEIYWSVEEEQKPEHEGFKLKTVEHDGKNYVLPEFYVKSDKTGEIKSWQPSDEKTCFGEDPYNPIYLVGVDDEELYASEFVLEGIMQCVQRGGSRWLYQHLDPGYSPTTHRSTLFYKELYDE